MGNHVGLMFTPQGVEEGPPEKRHSFREGMATFLQGTAPAILRSSILILGLCFISNGWAQRPFSSGKSNPSSTPSRQVSRKARPHVVVQRSLEDYLSQARQAEHAEMVDLRDLVQGVVLDLKYASSDNFMQEPLYPKTARPWLRREAAEKLAKVQIDLKKHGLGLKIFDAYRPWSVTQSMWNARRSKGIHARFLAPPWIGSNHNRGVAVDATLIDLTTGRELEMPTDFDSFSQRAHSSYPHLNASVRANRELLKKAMRRHGFHTIRSEWWHFELGNAGEFSVLDLDFEALDQAARVGSAP